MLSYLHMFHGVELCVKANDSCVDNGECLARSQGLLLQSSSSSCVIILFYELSIQVMSYF